MKTTIIEQDSLREENLLLKQQVDYLQEQIGWLKRQLFGRKSEKIIHHSAEINWLPGFENYTSQTETKKEEVIVVPQHNKRKPNRNGSESFEYPENLPIERHILDLTEEEKVCPNTGKALVVIGEDITRKLAKKQPHFTLKKLSVLNMVCLKVERKALKQQTYLVSYFLSVKQTKAY